MYLHSHFINPIKEFVTKHFSLISFISILLGGVFYYAASILESQSRYVFQLEKSNKIYVDLLDKQGVILQNQQQMINDLQCAVSAKIPASMDLHALK
jgi:hypothetical protein